METQLVYLSIPQGSLEKLEIVAAKKGLAVEQVIQEAIDEFLERPIHLNSWECAYSARTRDPSFGIPRPLLIHALRQSLSGCARFCCCLRSGQGRDASVANARVANPKRSKGAAFLHHRSWDEFWHNLNPKNR